MTTTDHIRIIQRLDDEEEGDCYFEYHALDENEKVIKGSRWTHLDKHQIALYITWLEEHEVKVTENFTLEG